MSEKLYSKNFFSRMRFPVYELPPETDLLSRFPELKRYEAFNLTPDGLDTNQILRYIFFCYDPNALKDIADLIQRKETAARLAGFTKTTEKIIQLFNNEIPEVNDMISAFCRLLNDRKFQMKIMAQEAFYQYQKIILEPIRKNIDDDKRMRAANLKTKLLEDCKLIDSMISKYEEELYGSEKEAKQIQENSTPVSPENITKRSIHV